MLKLTILTLAILSVFASQSYQVEPKDISEPAYDVILEGSNYEVRSYGKRYVAETCMCNGTGNAFKKLAGYIGVMGTPQNSSGTKMPMTKPVAEYMAKNDEGKDCERMQFFLPAEYDDMSKVPAPLDSAVTIKEIPAEVGAVYKFFWSWWYTYESAKGGFNRMISQLNDDGLSLGESTPYQLWQYDGPWTLFFRRNEVWVELTNAQVDILKQAKQLQNLRGN